MSTSSSTTSAEVTTTTKPSAKVGDAITLTGSDTKLSVTLVKVVDPAPAQSDIVRPKGRFVAVQLRLENVGGEVYDGTIVRGPVLIDASDQTYDPYIVDSGAGPGFGATLRIATADARLGFVTFDVPKDIVLRKFQLTLDFGWASETGEWLLT